MQGGIYSYVAVRSRRAARRKVELLPCIVRGPGCIELELFGIVGRIEHVFRVQRGGNFGVGGIRSARHVGERRPTLVDLSDLLRRKLGGIEVELPDVQTCVS